MLLLLRSSCLLLMLLVVLPACWAQDSFIDELDEQIVQGVDWWDEDWLYQQVVLVTDPNLKVIQSAYILLDQPRPLLLANTGRLRRDYADLRILGPDLKPLECGVLHPDLDTDRNRIWVKLNDTLSLMRQDKPLRLALYYGNPGAQPLPVEPPTDHSEPLAVQSLGETVAPGRQAPAPPQPGAFHGSLVVAECERFIDPNNGKDSFVHRRTPNRRLFPIYHGNPSGGYYLCPDIPWRHRSHDDYPVIANSSVSLPRAGTWYVHVRYKVTEYVYRTSLRRFPKRVHFKLVPFTLQIGDQTLTCGEDQTPGADFRYDHFELELPAGELPLSLVMPDKAGPDVIIFTQDPDYRPDKLDITGPVWLRLRLRELPDPATRYMARVYCYIRPWSSRGPEGEFAGILFRDKIATDLQDAAVVARDPDLWLREDEWSPWVQLMESTMPTWWTRLTFMPDQGPGTRRGMADVTVEFQLASRPDVSRVFQGGVEHTGTVTFHDILMPRRKDINTMLAETMSFGQWAEKRFDRVQAMGLSAGEGPQEIIMTTMAVAQSPVETEYIMRTCSLLGFNAIDMRSPLPREAFWEMADAHDLGWATAHHWYPKLDYTTWPLEPPAGQTHTQTAKALVQDAADLWFSPDGPRWSIDRPRTNLLIMGDEIGPATNPPLIQHIPLLMGWFREYLQEQGLTPAFFGKEGWEEVEPFWYRSYSATSELGKLINRIRDTQGLEPLSDWDGPKPPESPDEELAPVDDGSVDAMLDALMQAMMEAEQERQVAERTVTLPDKETATLEQKRLYYWSQKFRGHYTYHFYGSANRKIRQNTADGHFKVKPMASPNFQALPIMRSQMWDGALNLFEWARSGTTDFLFIEDWIMHPYRVAFGMGVLRSAARKHQQDIGLLIVGGNMKTRYLAALGQGSRAYLSYLYGPLRVIGPPWADHQPTIRQWAELLRAVRQTEADLLASRNRPAEAAILFAVSNDLNSPYINYVYGGYPMGERAHIWVALQDSQIPAEVISEEEIMEDPEALARYKTLYVGDLHVRDDVQERIRQWVAEGGTLWGSYAALARQEYDQPTDRFDDVFGLAERALIEPAPKDLAGLEAATIVVPEGIDGLTAVEVEAAPIQPAWRLSTAKPLATFADGQPAFIHNRYGKGQAYLLGSTTLPLTGGYNRQSAEPPYAAASRRLVAIAAESAGVDRHLTLSHPRVINFVHDGPEQAVVFLVSAYEDDLQGLQARVKLPRRPIRGYSGRGETIEFAWSDGWATFTTDLATLDGKIIVFRYE